MATCLLWRPATLTKTEKNRNTELFFYQVFAFINEVFIYLFTVVFFAFQAWARCNIYQDSEWSRGETEAQGVGRSSPVVLWSVGDSTPVGWLDGTHSLDVNYISWRWASRVNLPYFCLPLNCVRGNVSCRSTVPADCIFRYRLCFWSFVDLFVPWFNKFGTLARNSITQIAAPVPNDLQGWTGGFGAAQLLTELSPRDSLASLNLHPSRNIWLSPRRSTHHLRWSRARCPFAPSRNGKCREASNDLQR
jgi:hypothetical protein